MLNWAILGTGFISNAVIDAIAQSDSSTASLIVGRNPDKVADFQQRHGIKRGTTSFDEALADPEIDAVYIGLPNHQHHPFAIAAAKAGKAVLSEKSLTTTMQSAQELIAAAQQHETFFVEGLMYLSHPMYHRVTELLTDGRLGQLRSINARYGANIAHLVNPEGRGTIYNLGCYPISLTHLVVQTMHGHHAFAQRTVAAAGNVNTDDGTVSDAAITIRFGGTDQNGVDAKGGVLATVQSSDNYGNTSEFSIAGDHGVLRFETNPWLPEAGDNVLIWQPHGGEIERIVVTDTHDAFFHQIKMVERHVAAGDTQAQRPSPRHNDSLEIMDLLTEWETQCLTALGIETPTGR